MYCWKELIYIDTQSTSARSAMFTWKGNWHYNPNWFPKTFPMIEMKPSKRMQNYLRQGRWKKRRGEIQAKGKVKGTSWNFAICACSNFGSWYYFISNRKLQYSKWQNILLDHLSNYIDLKVNWKENCCFTAVACFVFWHFILNTLSKFINIQYAIIYT